MLAGLSSMTSTFAMSGENLTAGYRPSDLDCEAARIEVTLLHDRRHETIQLVAVFGRQRFGGDDKNRYARRCGIIMKRIHHVKTAHIRHQQVEHDQIGQLLSRSF